MKGLLLLCLFLSGCVSTPKDEYIDQFNQMVINRDKQRKSRYRFEDRMLENEIQTKLKIQEMKK